MPGSRTPVHRDPEAGAPVSGGPRADAPGAGAGAQEGEPAHAWTPSSPASAPHWDSPAPVPGSAPDAAGPGPLPPQEPGTQTWPADGVPGSTTAYRFPSVPTADHADASPVPEPQQPGIVAGEPPAPPAGPESHSDSEVTSLAQAAPAPVPPPAPQPQAAEPESDAAARTEAGEAPGPGPEAVSQPRPEHPESEHPESEQAATGTEAGPGHATGAPPTPGTEPAAEAGSEAAPEPEPGSESDPASDSEGGPAGAAEADGEADPADEEDAAPLPEAVETEDEHPHVSYVLRVNGVDRPVASAWIGESLLYVLRERLGLAGAKDGCSQGECGACSVQVDGRLVAACLVPAATAAGSEVRTVEGLSADGTPSDVQCALAESGSVQCGFCVPGLAMTVHDLLEGNHAPTELETRKAISGNLCRCSGYRGVLDAVRTVVEQRAARAEREAAEAEAQEQAQAHAQSQAAIDQQHPGHGQYPGHADHGQGGFDPQSGYAHGGYEQQPVPYEQQQGGYEQQPGGGYGPGAYDEGATYGGVPYEQGGHGQSGHEQSGYEQNSHEQGGYGPDGYGYEAAYPDGTYPDGTYPDGTYGAHIPHQTRHPENGGES
ncbi:(2Fe-2S)-binding protein [Streptomyces sp. DW4-2]|uniref:(2Fe-2S)-binding protein n=2 Tax=Streptomyces spirodelae TaxID=2812904 RepID=A0ABS3WNU2_9ACTN|nr:(2Fe-2S)-binding protein [Streptomyces spirodelae]